MRKPKAEKAIDVSRFPVILYVTREDNDDGTHYFLVNENIDDIDRDKLGEVAIYQRTTVGQVLQPKTPSRRFKRGKS